MQSLLLHTDYRARRADLQKPWSHMAPSNSQTTSNFHLATLEFQRAGTEEEMEGVVEDF